jgi:hypothetical protein
MIRKRRTGGGTPPPLAARDDATIRFCPTPAHQVSVHNFSYLFYKIIKQ